MSTWCQCLLQARRPLKNAHPVVQISIRRGSIKAAALETQVLDSYTEYPTVPFRASIDFKSVVDNVATMQQNAKNRLSTADPEKVAVLYGTFVDLTQRTNALRSERNHNSNAMKVCMMHSYVIAIPNSCLA